MTVTFFSSCSPTQVVVEKDKYEDFRLENNSTFDFARIDIPNDSLVAYEQIVELLKINIVSAMEDRGLKLDPSDPDFRINLGLVVEDKTKTRETSATSDPFTYSGQRSYYWEIKEIPVETYRQGSLTVHFVKASGNLLVWAGTISEVVPKKQADKNAAIQNAVDQIFKYIDNNNK